MNGAKDPYDALGVSRTASADEIKKAYRRLAREYHPDASGGDKAKETRFKEITAAYEVLGDPEKRARYDAWRAGPQPGFGGGGGAGFPEGLDLGDLFAQVFAGAAGGQTRRTSTPGGGFVFEMGNFGSPFDSAPRRRRRRTTPAQPRRAAPAERKVRAKDGSLLTQRGADVYSDVRLGFDQAVLGSVAEVATLSGKAKLKIPPGTSSGVRLRLKGKGAAKDDGTRGDHFVTVQIDVPKKIDEEAERLLAQLMQRLRKDTDR